MSNTALDIEDFISTETERVKKKRPVLQRVEVLQTQDRRGSFYSTLMAKTRNKTITLKQVDRCQYSGIKKLFENLTRVLRRKNNKRAHKINLV